MHRVEKSKSTGSHRSAEEELLVPIIITRIRDRAASANAHHYSI